MAKFNSYQTTYFYDSGTQTVIYSHEYKKPEHAIGDTIQLTLFVDKKIKHIPSKIIKIVQELKETNEDLYIMDLERC